VKRSAATLSRRYQAKFDWHQQISPGHVQDFDSYLGAGWQCGETRNDVGTRVRRASLAGRMATDKYEKKDKKNPALEASRDFFAIAIRWIPT
jgi:hypothetical protein